MSTPGDFSFIKYDVWREVLTHDYASLTHVGWHALKHHDESESFMWDTNGPVWDSIRSKMYEGHTATTMACSLKNLEHIAKYGWGDFVSDITWRHQRHSEFLREQLQSSRDSECASGPS